MCALPQLSLDLSHYGCTLLGFCCHPPALLCVTLWQWWVTTFHCNISCNGECLWGVFRPTHPRRDEKRFVPCSKMNAARFHGGFIAVPWFGGNLWPRGGLRVRSHTRFHTRFHGRVQAPVSWPVSWAVSWGGFSSPVFVSGFMGGFMGYETTTLKPAP